MENPSVYKPCIRSEYFSLRTYFWWVVRGFYQGIVMFVFTMGAYGVTFHHSGNQTPADYDSVGITFFVIYLWVQTFTLQFELKYCTKWNLWIIWGFHFFTIFCLWVFNLALSFDSLLPYFSTTQAIGDMTFWLLDLWIASGFSMDKNALLQS